MGAPAGGERAAGAPAARVISWHAPRSVSTAAVASTAGPSVAIQRLYEITTRGLSVKSDLWAIRRQLLANPS